MTEISKSLAPLIVDQIEARMFDLHTGLPARVESFDASKQSCSVKVLLQRFFLDDDGVPQSFEYPVIQNVPIAYPAGGGWSITFPLNIGDIVFLAFSERSLDRWLDAPSGTIVDPVSNHKHDLSDAVAIPGLRPRSSPLPNIDANNMRLANDSGSVVIELTPNGILLHSGGVASESMILGDALVAALQALTVPTAFGPSGPPLNSAAFPPCKAATAKVGP